MSPPLSMKIVLLFFATAKLVEAYSTTPDDSPPDPDSGSMNPCKNAPIHELLKQNVECDSITLKGQSPMDITKGNDGAHKADVEELDPYPDFNDAGMCTVNIHWHLGAEHRSRGEYDECQDFPHPHLPSDWSADRPGCDKSSPLHRRLSSTEHAPPRVGHMCKNAKEMFENADPLVVNEYNWRFCKNMHVGLSYEFHWPHSNLGHCQSEWQLQHPFMDGVLCDATTLGLTLGEAADAIFNSNVAKIGVEGQVFTIVNSENPDASEYLYDTWDSLNGYYPAPEMDKATYQGSTTGDGADNVMCRATGGMVTWHVDRTCHKVEAKTIDNLCRMMLVVPSDDLSPDVEPHGSRETVPDHLSDHLSTRK